MTYEAILAVRLMKRKCETCGYTGATRVLVDGLGKRHLYCYNCFEKACKKLINRQLKEFGLTQEKFYEI